MKKTLSGIIIGSLVVAFTLSAGSTVFAAGRDLSYGASGDDVYTLQSLLADYGYFWDEPTGYFGELTEEALIAYQNDMGLDPDGVVGPLTQEFLGFETLADSESDEDSEDLQDPEAAQDTQAAETSETEGQEAASKPGPEEALDFTRVLSRGMDGKDVTALQQLLTIFGYFEEEATGFFGDLTYAAVIAFQEEHGLEADGVVGDETMNALITTPAAPGTLDEPTDTVDTQYEGYSEKVMAAIDNTPSTAAGYCASWVTEVMQNAGVLNYNITSLRPSSLSYAASEGLTDGGYEDTGFNANDYWAYVCYSSDIDDLEPGMIVASRNSFTYLGRQFGHVGIYIGDGQVISSVGYLEVLDLNDWIDRYNNTEMGSTVKWGYLPL